jgi:site-specific recombinase XerD
LWSILTIHPRPQNTRLNAQTIFSLSDASPAHAQNIALKLPYPKIKKTVPQFLTIDEYNRLIRHFSEQIDSHMGLRDLIIIMLLGENVDAR